MCMCSEVQRRPELGEGQAVVEWVAKAMLRWRRGVVFGMSMRSRVQPQVRTVRGRVPTVDHVCEPQWRAMQIDNQARL